MTTNGSIDLLLIHYIEEYFSPTNTEKEFIQELYSSENGIRELLKQHGYYCFRSGSYVRRTATTPVTDLDIICESDNEDFEDFMNSDKGKGLYKILSEKYGEKNIDFQTHSIGISIINNEFTGIDLVIAKKIEEKNEFRDNLYIVPTILYKNRELRKSIYEETKTKGEKLDVKKSDPRGYKSEMLEIKEINPNIIFATRFLKKWKWVIKQECYLEDEKFLKSFHIEEIVKRTIKANMNLGLLDLIIQSLKNINLDTPNIPDRADKEEMIDSYIEEPNFNKSKAQQYILKLLNEISILNESNFTQMMGKIFVNKERKEIIIDNKNKSYYAFR